MVPYKNQMSPCAKCWLLQILNYGHLPVIPNTTNVIVDISCQSLQDENSPQTTTGKAWLETLLPLEVRFFLFFFDYPNVFYKQIDCTYTTTVLPSHHNGYDEGWDSRAYVTRVTRAPGVFAILVECTSVIVLYKKIGGIYVRKVGYQ